MRHHDAALPWGFVCAAGLLGIALGLPERSEAAKAVPADREEDWRDPFVFGPRARTQAAVRVVGPTLLGIVWDATHPLAIVGEESVGIGDVVAGWRVVGIQQDGITVEREGRRERVSPGSSLPAEEVSGRSSAVSGQ